MKFSFSRIWWCFILLVVFLASPLLARAENQELADQYRTATRELLQSLKKNINVFGLESDPGVPVDFFLQELESVKIIATSDFVNHAGGTRKSAFYVPAKKTIYLNLNVKHIPELMPVLGLHELFGVTGKIEDNNYQISMATSLYVRRHQAGFQSTETDPGLFLLTGAIKMAIRQGLHRRGLPPQINEHDREARVGGGTLVGGGGDAYGLYFKFLLLEAALSEATSIDRVAFFYTMIRHVEIALVQDSEMNEIQFLHIAANGLPREIRVPFHWAFIEADGQVKNSDRAIKELITMFLR
jgi:hypothetical protein